MPALYYIALTIQNSQDAVRDNPFIDTQLGRTCCSTHVIYLIVWTNCTLNYSISATRRVGSDVESVGPTRHLFTSSGGGLVIRTA